MKSFCSSVCPVYVIMWCGVALLLVENVIFAEKLLISKTEKVWKDEIVLTLIFFLSCSLYMLRPCFVSSPIKSWLRKSLMFDIKLTDVQRRILIPTVGGARTRVCIACRILQLHNIQKTTESLRSKDNWITRIDKIQKTLSLSISQIILKLETEAISFMASNFCKDR